MIKGIIFDADGTLIDSMPIWHEVSLRYLTRRGLKADDDLADRVFTMTLDEGCAYIKELYRIPDTIEQMSADILSEIRDFYYYEVQLKPGVREFIRGLQERKIPMVIATAGVRETLEAALSRLGILDCFDELFFCTELSTSKREPLIYGHAARYLGMQPSEICVFEDALYAVRTAKSAGFNVIGIADETQTDERGEIMHTADMYFDGAYDFDRFKMRFLA